MFPVRFQKFPPTNKQIFLSSDNIDKELHANKMQRFKVLRNLIIKKCPVKTKSVK